MIKKHNANLDILRGVAALMVVLFHLVNIYGCAFDKHIDLGHYINYSFPGHLSVLVFFILSGYVINANTGRLTNKSSIFGYIRKRLTRIVPVYFIAIFFTVLVTYGKYGWPKILSNLFFISVPLDNVYAENGSLWSLNYELIYYFVFILFSYFNINLVKTVKVLLAVIALLFLCFHNVKIHPLIISYVVGFLFWITGAMLAEIKYKSEWQITGSRMIAIFVILLCLVQLNPYFTILGLLHIPYADYSGYSFFQQSLSWHDIFYLPYSIFLILAMTHSYSKYANYLIYCTFLLCLFQFVMLWKVFGFDYMTSQNYVFTTIFLFISTALWVGNFDINAKIKTSLKKAAALGNVSYGIYIIHVPLIFGFGLIITATPVTFAIKLITFFITLLFVSWLLEEKYQLWVKGILRKILPRNSSQI